MEFLTSLRNLVNLNKKYQKQDFNYQIRAFLSVARFLGTNTWEKDWKLCQKLVNYFGIFLMVMATILSYIKLYSSYNILEDIV